METKQFGVKLPEWNSYGDKYGGQHTSEVQLFSSDPGSHRAGGYSHLVLQLVGIGIPVLLAGSFFCWGDHHTGWSAYVHQRRSARRKPHGSALRRRDFRAAPPAACFDLNVFTPTGRIKVGVIWDLSVKKIDDGTCEFTNLVHSSFTPELLDSLARQGIPREAFQSARKPISEAHNHQETPLFAKSIERHALRNNNSTAVASAA